MRGYWVIATVTLALSQAPSNRVPIAAPPAEVRLDVAAGLTNDVVSMAISPDGRKLVYMAAAGNIHQLWLRFLDSERVQALPGTEGATLPFPFWSPDSKSIGFFSDGKLKRMDLESMSIRTLVTNMNWGRGGTWSQNGTILFSRIGGGVINQVSDNGGTVLPVTRLESPQQLIHEHPQFLPDGRHFLYYVDGLPSARGIYAASTDGSENKRLVDSEGAGSFTAGRLLFVNHGTLYAQEFDPIRLSLSGNPSRLADNVPVVASRAAFSTSLNGHFAYRTGSAGSTQHVTWFDRSGNRLETVGAPFLGGGAAPSLSPDRRTLVLQQYTDGNLDLWLLNMDNGIFTRFTSDASRDNYPVWSSDGRRIVFSSNRNGNTSYEMYEKPVGVTAIETLMLSTPGLRHPMDWSKDGRYLLYRMNSPDLWALRINGLFEIPILRGPAELLWPQFSPDGKWIAFESNESGKVEVHIHGPFEPPSLGQTSRPISTNGGVWARWRGDGKEFYYLAPDGMLMAVPIDFNSNGQDFKAGTPVPLFALPVIGWESSNFAQQYVPSDDGQRFLVIDSPNAESPMKVTLNWKP